MLHLCTDAAKLGGTAGFKPAPIGAGFVAFRIMRTHYENVTRRMAL